MDRQLLTPLVQYALDPFARDEIEAVMKTDLSVDPHSLLRRAAESNVDGTSFDRCTVCSDPGEDPFPEADRV